MDVFDQFELLHEKKKSKRIFEWRFIEVKVILVS